MDGATRYHSGLAAEASVLRHYVRLGAHCLAERWRGRAGEIDLIFQQGEDVIFVEVKRAATIARAAERLAPRQSMRLLRAAEEYLSQLPAGLSSPSRFDVALVDATGRVETLQNALMA
ncbi:hypothetical protein CG51_04510 [Haematobacter missouriensis]|uniref:UPF0102 protein CDV52_02890 n=1 Tax=Haematobacter missouriensis TaxID=366616 RepID=A0A212AXB4_9RHOB|nr:YraN family protein [Haematobacter missouriensis]KFI34127.1 hypothetical protein CG51_04510 [Haematobacter missouriensis]OWJ78366.1 hypothetical protein CDV53_03935 [Haematobacter missouriensis]OWJ86115.1 hypothetical protein CDV52_02890 [Haematobacter missouriensis]